MRSKQFALAKPWWLLPIGRVDSSWWYAMGAALIALDYLGGPNGRFPVLYLIPVILAAWYSGRRPALGVALMAPLAHVVFLVAAWPQPQALMLPVLATVFRASIIILLALWFARLSEHERELRGYVLRLEGLLSICSFCKSIRTETGEWERLETFISRRTQARFSHGLCANCGKTHYPDLDLDDAASDRVELKT